MATPVSTSKIEIADYVEETARCLGVKLDAAALPGVVAVFGVLARNAEALMAHELPESVEPSPVFRIPAEGDG
jgi:hypothetical protein